MFMTNGYDCKGIAILNIIKYFSIIFNIIFILIPIGLIVMISIDIFKNIIGKEEDYGYRTPDINSNKNIMPKSNSQTSTNINNIIEKSTNWLEEQGHFYINNNSSQQYGQQGGYNYIGFVTISWVNAGVDLEYKKYSNMQSLYDDMLKKDLKKLQIKLI